MFYVVFVSVSILLVCMVCEGQQTVGNSFVQGNSAALGQFAETTAVTNSIDNTEFSQGLSTGSFIAGDFFNISGASITNAFATRGDGQNIDSGALGFSSSLLRGVNPDGRGVVGQGASSVLAFASEESAGVDASAATEAALYNTDDGYLVFQNQAGGVAFTKFGTAQYNYTSGFNATGSNSTVSELVNVKLVSNQNQTGSSLTICTGSTDKCTNFVPAP